VEAALRVEEIVWRLLSELVQASHTTGVA
jgi:hypothetical protein